MLVERLLLMAAVLAFAVDDARARNIAPDEFQALSPLCQTVFSPDVSRAESLKQMGPSVAGACGIHHTCSGELAVMRYRKAAAKIAPASDRKAQATLQRKRRYWLQKIVSEFGYEIRCAPPTYPLLPMIHTERGKALLLQGNRAGALQDLNRALELNPNYAPARAALGQAMIPASPKPRR